MTIDTTRTRVTGRMAIDLGLMVGAVLLVSPHGSGIAVHEWVGIAIAPEILYHLTLNWTWIVQFTRKAFQRLPTETRLNQFLNAVLFAAMAVATWTGVVISVSALPALGIYPVRDIVWRDLHSVSSYASLTLVGVHASTHWQWIARSTRRILGMNLRRIVRPVSIDAGLPINLEGGSR